MIIRSKRLIFVHVQKTGGNSIASALGEPPDCPEKHFLARDLRECYGSNVWNDCFKFAFVRNPWDRLVSWWSMIKGNREAYENGTPANNFQSFVLSRSTTFEEFLDCDQEIIDVDGPKWIYRNQIDYLTDTSDRLIVDFVGRFESIQQDFETVMETTLGQSYTLPHFNRSTHHHYSKYYDFAMAKKVEARFARDIAAFGYTFGK
jgi:Sulfotransferase family